MTHWNMYMDINIRAMNIKKFFAVVLVVSLCGSVMAQTKKLELKEGRGKHPEITELVKDLSSVQKHKIESITKESKTKIEGLRNQQKAVRDSIGIIMDRQGDQSKLLFPLFDREGALHSRISQEMYKTKLKIDEVLTKEQARELKSAMSKNKMRKGPKNRGK